MSFTGLHRALGIEAQEITFDMVERAVQEGVRETYDLDWKSELPEQKKLMTSDLPKDVAAMANSGGGVVIYGVSEQEKAATALIGVTELTENYEQTLMRAPIHKIHPPVHGVVPHILRQGDKTVLVLEVPASEEVPHLVDRNELFGAPIRVGADTHWMTEPEIERMYRRRFDARRYDGEALQQLLEDLSAYARDDAAWMICAARPLHPNLSSSLSKDVARQVIQEAAANQELAKYWGAGPLVEAHNANPRRGYRSWVFQNQGGLLDHLAPSVMVVSDDGTVGLAIQIGGFVHADNATRFETDPQVIEVTVSDLISAARSLSERTRTSMYDIAVEVITEQPVTVFGYTPFGVERSRAHRIERFRSIRSSLDVSAAKDEVLQATRDLALDCLNQGGVEQLRQIHVVDSET